MKTHEIDAKFSVGIIINGVPERRLFVETLVKHGIEKNDQINITPGDSIVDLPFSWEIYNTLKNMGYTKVELLGRSPDYIDL